MKINTNIILNAIRNADEKKKSFYRQCYEADYAFDVESGDEKFEIKPCRMSGYLSDATVYARGYEEAEISYEDLRDAVQ